VNKEEIDNLCNLLKQDKQIEILVSNVGYTTYKSYPVARQENGILKRIDFIDTKTYILWHDRIGNAMVNIIKDLKSFNIIN
jgi:short-subunit dehydrogenase